MKKLSIALIIAAIIIAIGFAISGIAQESISQSNSTNIDKQNIIVTWMETNKTKASSSSTPMIMVNDQDFWMVFGPLLEQTINETTSSFD